MEMCMLTTTDNPYDPFTQYEAWYRFDEDNGYHSCAFLARIARTSDQLSDKENQEEIERAINDIIKYDPWASIKGQEDCAIRACRDRMMVKPMVAIGKETFSHQECVSFCHLWDKFNPPAADHGLELIQRV